MEPLIFGAMIFLIILLVFINEKMSRILRKIDPGSEKLF
jgi:hypothetical protein